MFILHFTLTRLGILCGRYIIDPIGAGYLGIRAAPAGQVGAGYRYVGIWTAVEGLVAMSAASDFGTILAPDSTAVTLVVQRTPSKLTMTHDHVAALPS